MLDLYRDELETPVGLVTVISDGTALRAVDFEDYEERRTRLLAKHYGEHTLHAAKDPGGAVSRLRAYFAGDLAAIEGLAVATNGTEFQRLVWAALREIPVGTTVSYGTIAERIGRPKSCRAVGLANGSNPIAIVVPCHRVIGANATLTGYGGGLERKRWLLAHEGLTDSA
jgi:methylated-DNA-[protein]-cysteine S-methyltransferase